jgi:hypothetical protein
MSSDYDSKLVILSVSKYAYSDLLRNEIDTKASHLIFFKNLPGKEHETESIFHNFFSRRAI